jgi:hypothetical protein
VSAEPEGGIAEELADAHALAGDFFEAEEYLLLLECRAPEAKRSFIQELCAAWKSVVAKNRS